MAMMSTQTLNPEAGAPLELSIPSLLFDNRTEYDALHFDTLDQNDTPFHVIVAKIGYTFSACNDNGEAQLAPLDEAVELNLEDQYYEDDLANSVRQESDLAPYKPHCDVIVNADAYAPHGKPNSRFMVQLRVQRPDIAAPLPERPNPLNPLQGLSPAVFQAWQEEVALARTSVIPGAILIDKTLAVSGERRLQKKFFLIRLFQFGVKICSFGLIQPNPWRLTKAKSCVRVPVRYEFAQGGQCRIETTDKAAKRIPKKYQLTELQMSQHPDQDAPPVAHDACMTNPVGRGFSRRWYLAASRLKRIAAPQIDYFSKSSGKPFTARRFWQAAAGQPLAEPAGLGFIGRAWMQRRQFIGEVNNPSQWDPEAVPRLPKEFDFQYWNGAPADQQCEHLVGEERVSLVNLSAPTSPLARDDANGNSILRFVLPRQSFFLMAAQADGGVGIHPLIIDTVTIDSKAGRLDLVWRICLPADGDISEVRLMHSTNEEQLQRLQGLQTQDTPATSQRNSYPLPE